MKTRTMTMALVAMICVTALQTEARIKLVALPERGDTVVRLDNPAFTLIEEERVLTLQQGVNKVDFSWKGVFIDADSIRMTVLSHTNGVVLLNVSYPPNEQALVWEIGCNEAAEVKVRISYLLSNIDRLVTYKLVADKDETKVDFKSYLVLRNFSGEDFANARVTLDYGEAFEKGIAHEETKQLLFLKPGSVPIEKVWTFDAAKQAWDPEKLDVNVGIPVSYRIKNTKESKLGSFALWNGKIRVFQDDGHSSTIFLGEDQAKIVPVGDKMEVYLGDSRDIVVTQRKMKDEKTHVRRDRHEGIVLYDTDEELVAKIENFKDKPAKLTMIQNIEGQWEMTSCTLDKDKAAYERKDFRTLKFEIELPAHGKKELTMKYHRLNIRPGLEQVTIQ